MPVKMVKLANLYRDIFEICNISIKKCLDSLLKEPMKIYVEAGIFNAVEQQIFNDFFILRGQNTPEKLILCARKAEKAPFGIKNHVIQSIF